MKQVNVYPIGTEVWYFDPILEGYNSWFVCA